MLVLLLPPTAQPRLPVPVEGRPLLRIAQDVVGLRDRLEFLFGLLRSAIAVRMPLHRQTTIGLLDVVVGCIARYTQHRVKISHVENPEKGAANAPHSRTTGQESRTRR